MFIKVLLTIIFLAVMIPGRDDWRGSLHPQAGQQC